MKFLKREVREVESNYYRCENLTTNLSYTPILCSAESKRQNRSPTKAAVLIERAARASCECPIGTSYLALGQWSAPRLVLMRCVTSSEVVLVRSLLSYFDELPCLSDWHVGEAHLCPLGKVPCGHEDSSSKQSLLGKACLVSGRKFDSEIKRILIRSDEAGRCLKNSLCRTKSHLTMAAKVIEWVHCSQCSSLVSHRSPWFPQPYLGACCREQNTYMIV